MMVHGLNRPIGRSLLPHTAQSTLSLCRLLPGRSSSKKFFCVFQPYPTCSALTLRHFDPYEYNNMAAAKAAGSCLSDSGRPST